MEDLYYYIQEAEKALKQINSNIGNKLTDLEFQILIGKKLGYSSGDSTKIMIHRLSAEDMINMLEPKDLLKAIVIAEVKFDKSILPEGTPGRLDEKQIKVSGEIWKINKNDPDPLPSDPHGHNIETGCKLHLGNGELYSPKNKPLNKKISNKDLLRIRGELKGIALPKLTI